MRNGGSSWLVILGLLVAMGVSACTTYNTNEGRAERMLGGIMGTSVQLDIRADDRWSALEASETAVQALEEVEARLSTWIDRSELARLNQTPAGEPCALSQELARDLSLARLWWRRTEGAFDPGIGSLVSTWGLREGGRMPSDSEIQQALLPGGMAALELEDDRAIRRHPQLLLEEGAFGKGIGLAAARDALHELDIRDAMIDLGGQVLVIGDRNHTIGVADPTQRHRSLLKLRVSAGSLATSGNSERGIEVDGESLGHLLDPRTGYPVPDFGSLTVWSPDPVAADCLSTGLYVMGPDKAFEWIAARPAIPVEVLIVQRQGNRWLVRATAGFRDAIEEPVPGLEIQFEPPST